MKLSITQMVLGTLILLAACYIVGWMIFGTTSVFTMPRLEKSMVMEGTELSPENPMLFAMARYASGILFGLALMVLLVGAFQVSMHDGKKLAITQIIGGVLITAIYFFINTWGYPTSFIVPMPAGSRVGVYINPGPPMIYAIRLTNLSFLLGLAVLDVGIVQFVKARKH